MVINFVLDMLRGESDLLKENKRENTGVRRHNGNSLLSKKKTKVCNPRHIDQRCLIKIPCEPPNFKFSSGHIKK